MKKKFLYLVSVALGSMSLIWLNIPIEAEASHGEEYITISVDAADDNEGLMYALDTDDPDAFTSNNTFEVPAGTSHTIYVKDVAGNITSETYTADSSDTIEEYEEEYTYLTDSKVAEPGQGTTFDKTVTDGSSDAEKLFYTITTEEGDVFYLVVDQKQGTNNVYLMNQVTNSELQALAVDDTGVKKEQENEERLLQELQNSNATEAPEEVDKKSSTGGKEYIVLILVAIVLFGYYYLKVYQKKKDSEMDLVDAKDMDEFEAEEDEEEFRFDEYTEEEKDAFLEELLTEGDVYEEEDYMDEKEEGDEESIADIPENAKEQEKINQTFLEEEMDFDPDLDGEEEE